jgi:carboxymethylenebutenolidase
MGEQITIKGKDGSFAGYLAKPASGTGPGIVVIQEIFGINDNIRDVADRLAAAGFVALAPDLFWRLEAGLDLDPGKEADLGKAFDLFGKFNADTGITDIKDAIATLRAMPGVTGKVGAVGYCLGGMLAYLTAARTDADACVSYYGVNIANMLGEATSISRPLLMHVAGEDKFVPADAQAAMAKGLAAHSQVTMVTWHGRDHGFSRLHGDGYHAGAAASADAATIGFFQRFLG